MHLDLPHLVYSGPPIDDPNLLARLPAELAAALAGRNGCVAYLGGLHVRGACREPAWHSLRAAWEGEDAFHQLYPKVEPEDLPFAENALGDQFLLRAGAVLRLAGETGDLDPVSRDLEGFLTAVLADAPRVLNLEPLLALNKAGSRLEPGQLLAVHPPLVTAEAREGFDLRPVDAMERRRFLARLARRIGELPDGAPIDLADLS